MEYRRLLCRDGAVHLYCPPLEITDETVRFSDAEGVRHEVARADISEISVESGGGAHPDDEEMAGIEPE